MQAEVQWGGELNFTGRSEGPMRIELQGGGPPPDERSGFSPLQLILIGMIGCTAMDVISILEKMRQEVSDFHVKAEADQQEVHPRVFTRIQLDYRFRGSNLDPELVEKAIDLSLNRYCPATAMLRKSASVDYSYTIGEEG